MIKKERCLFLRVFLFVLFIFLINIGMFVYKYGNFNEGFRMKGITGLLIKEIIPNAYKEISPLSKIFLIAQWSLLILVLLFTLIKDKGIRSRRKELVSIDLKKMKEKNGTDLDTLYNILQNKGQIRISTITKIFDVKKSIAMDWCKTLESGNLATIDYPAGRGPVLKIVNKKMVK